MNKKQAQLDLSKVKDGLSSMGGKITDWWGAVPDEAKKTMLRTAIGAGAGGLLAHTATGGFGDKEYRPGISPALLGALLGGGAAFAAPMGMKLLKGDIRFAPKAVRNPVDAGLNAAGGAMLHNPATTAGLAGSVWGWHRFAPTAGGVRRAANRTAKNRPGLEKVITQLQQSGTAADKQKILELAGMASKNINPKNFPRANAKLPKLMAMLSKVKNPKAWAMTAGTMAAAPIAGHLVDRYIFGRNS